MGLRICILFFGLSLAVAMASPWKTDDQKAYSYYKNKELEKAEKLFQDAYWKATVAYRRGHFEPAIKGFKNVKTADGFYNLGNAYAYSGDLKQAVSAYQKALKLSPKDKDIKFNLELVKKLLKQQQEKQKQDKQENQKEQNKEEQNKKQQNKEQQDKQQNKQEPNNEKKEQQDKKEQNRDKKEKRPDKQEQNKEQVAKEKEEQETQQWLKFIEEDPAGLLRQKFLRDYQKVLEGA